MKVRAILHEAEEGGYWAEVPAILHIPGHGDWVSGGMSIRIPG